MIHRGTRCQGEQELCTISDWEVVNILAGRGCGHEKMGGDPSSMQLLKFYIIPDFNAIGGIFVGIKTIV